MTKKMTTKRALLASVFSLVICVAMLVGSTFAWFTDSASTGVNTITAGNLDIKLSYKNAADSAYNEVSAQTTDLFVNSQDGEIRWEPGAASVCYFKIENLGSLALQYKVKVSYNDTVTYTGADGEVKLSNAIKSAFVDLGNTEKTYANRTELIAAAQAAGTAGLGYETTTAVKMQKETTGYFALILWMPEDIGNTYNLPTGARPLEIQFGVDVVATQVMEENDSFGNDYDEFAQWPNFPERIYVAETLPYTSEKIVVENYEKGYWITIPAGAVVPAESNPNPQSVTVAFNAEPGSDKITYTLALTDEKNNALTLSKAATIDTYLGLGLENVASADATVAYTESNGKIRISSANVGSYVVTYSNPNVTTVSNATEFTQAFEALATKPGHTISLAADIEMKDVAWTGVDNKSFTLLGNGYAIKNLNNTSVHYAGNKAAGGLVNELGAGNSVIIKNVTLEGVNVGNETDVNAGAVVGYADAAREITLENVTVTGATVTSSGYAGGLIGWNSGYGNTSDGAVYSIYTMKDCKVVNSTITGGGSTGGAVGHAGCSYFTTNTIDNFQMTGTTVTTTETKNNALRAEKVGMIVGTANIGDVVIANCEAADFSGNTVCGTENSNVIVGRLATSSGHGTLTINGTKDTADKTLFTIQ